MTWFIFAAVSVDLFVDVPVCAHTSLCFIQCIKKKRLSYCMAWEQLSVLYRLLMFIS